MKFGRELPANVVIGKENPLSFFRPGMLIWLHFYKTNITIFSVKKPNVVKFTTENARGFRKFLSVLSLPGMFLTLCQVTTSMTGMISRYLLIIFLVAAFSSPSRAQFFRRLFSSETDTNYIVDYSRDLTTRIFGSQKSASFRLVDGSVKKSLNYLPNERFLIGIGANHGILGLNIGINFPFINDDDDLYGTTDYINWTTRIIARKIYIDIILQYYKGYYLVNSYEMIRDWPAVDEYMIRPDLSTFSIGLSGQYIFNNKKFSYRAGFLQNEWQKKSAGSLLAGGEIYYHIMSGDSSMVPLNMVYNSFFHNQHFKKVEILSIGPLIGYAHTFVLKKHWFLSLSLYANLALGFSKLHPDEQYTEAVSSGLTLNLNTVPKIALGYNSPRWCFDISYNNLSQRNQSPFDQAWIHFDTGNFRFNIVYRFHLKKPVRLLNPEN